MTATNFSIPLNKRKALFTAMIVLFGCGLIIGYQVGQLGELMGVLIAVIGFLYIWKDYQLQKKAQKQGAAA